jgi:hypothetical protein
MRNKLGQPSILTRETAARAPSVTTTWDQEIFFNRRNGASLFPAILYVTGARKFPARPARDGANLKTQKPLSEIPEIRFEPFEPENTALLRG